MILMKFGKRLQFEASGLGLSQVVLDYKTLKRVIKEIVEASSLQDSSDEGAIMLFLDQSMDCA